MNKLPDLSTNWQKGLALGLLTIGAFLVVKLFTFIIAGIVLLIGSVFYKQIWDSVKMLSQYSTRWLIKNNTVYYLEKYYDYILKQYEEFSKATQEVGADMLVSEQKVSDLIKQREKASELHSHANDPKLSAQYETQVYALKEQIDFIMPVLEKAKGQYDIMKQIEEMREQDVKLFKIKMDANIEKFNILRGLNKASDKAKRFLGDNSSMEKEYKEAARQLEHSAASYIINIEDTNKKMLPELQKLQINNQYNAEKGREIIEAYKQSRLQITGG